MSLTTRFVRLAALALVCASLAAVAVLTAPAPAEAAPPIILDSTRCSLPPAPQPAVGNIQAVMIFVDFGTPSTATPDALFDAASPRAIAWYRDESRGRATLNITPIRRWYRMPRALEAYRPDNTDTPSRPLNPAAVVRDAVTAADSDVDFSPYTIVYVMLPPGVTNTSLAGNPGIAVDGIRLTGAAMLAGSNPAVLAHETGHLFGLPDLYDTASATERESARFVGSWDLMGSPTAMRLFAWHRWKLGWLDAAQMRCLGGGVLEEQLTPVGNLDTGLKMIVIPVSPTQVYVAELRDQVGSDKDICTRGVLIYLVDSGVRSGMAPGPIQVRPSGPSDARVQQCGSLYDAPFGNGRTARFQDAANNVTIEVLESSLTSFRVRVSAPEFTTGPVPPGGISLAVFSGGSTANMVNASGCNPATAAFWVTDASGSFITYIPGVRIAVVNEAWNARFPQGIPANSALIARCA